jgi:hypothetical protein
LDLLAARKILGEERTHLRQLTKPQTKPLYC